MRWVVVGAEKAGGGIIVAHYAGEYSINDFARKRAVRKSVPRVFVVAVMPRVIIDQKDRVTQAARVEKRMLRAQSL